MPILELSDAQVVELVKQLPPEQQRAALLALAAGGTQRERSGCSMRKRNCDVSAPSAAWTGTRCRRANAKLSLTIFCTRTVRAENSGLRHQYLALSSRLEGQALPVPRIGARGAVDGVTCRELLDELAEKLQSKLSFTPEQTLDTVADLLTFLRVIPITGMLKAVPADPDDDKVLECAAMAGATHIITGDRRHLLPLGTFQGIPILTAADFLAVATAP